GGAVPGAPVTIVNSETGLTRSVTTDSAGERSEEHTSELQSLTNLVCRLLLEKKNPGVPQGRERGQTHRRRTGGTQDRRLIKAGGPHRLAHRCVACITTVAAHSPERIDQYGHP